MKASCRNDLTRSLLFLFVVALSAAYAARADLPHESLRQLCEAAGKGDPKALYNLAYLHDIGFDSIPKDSVRSTELYIRSAEAGYLPAQNYIGFRMIKGEGGIHDPDRGLNWLRRAAVMGDAKAANNLGWLLMDGHLVERNYVDAAYWLGKAADAGLPVAMSQLADLYRYGKGVEPDSVKAVDLYSRAIEGGLRDAELKLLSMQHDSWLRLSPSDALAEAKRYQTLGAPIIAATLAEIASSGAMEALRVEVPDSDAVSTLADADTMLADAYSRAEGVEYDHDRALWYFVRGAISGNEESCKALSELLEILPDSLDSYYSEAEAIAKLVGKPVPTREEFISPEYWRRYE